MTVLKMVKYTDDDLRLEDVGDAEFLHRKIKDDTTLDFGGVTSATAAFLDALLLGITPEEIGDRLTGMNDEVDEALASWVDRAGAPVKPIERGNNRPRVRVTKPNAQPPALEREPITDDRFTPTRLVQRLSNSLRGYIESAYPLSDPSLVRARRTLLETEANGHLLAQEPFIETTTKYAGSEHSYNGLGLPSHMGEFFERLASTPTGSSDPEDENFVLYPQMYAHQADAFTSFLAQGRDVIVATGTGSGKTECFLVPMLGALYDEAHERPDNFALPGVRALILYPMNALVNDQLSRLRLLFGEPAVSSAFKALPSKRFPRFGMYTGRTPYPGPRTAGKDRERVAPLMEYYLNMDSELEQRLREMGRYPSKDLHAFFAQNEARKMTYKTGAKQGQEYTRHNWDKRLHTSPDDCELLTRHEMVYGAGTTPGHSPDILVTNYSMLEYMLMRPFERPIFAETRRWLEQDGSQLLLVLDEAHMYRGAKGAEVAFLLRRLRARLGIHNRSDKLRVIATSASLGSDDQALDNIRRFAADLCGKTPGEFAPITGTREVPSPAAPAQPDEAELLASIDLEALNEALEPEALRDCLKPILDFYGVEATAEDEQSQLAALHQALAGKEMVNQLVLEAASEARALSDLAERVFPSHPKQLEALQGLLALSTLARRKTDDPGLVPTRVHGMFRGLHGLYACINPYCSGRQSAPGERAAVGKLFSTPLATCDACGSRVFEMASCRSCGTPYMLAYATKGVSELEFLWGETEGDLTQIQLLPMEPRYPKRAEEIRVHLKTGYLDSEAIHADHEARSLYLWVNPDGEREPAFGQCLMCQPSNRGRARIYDFRTRGEQPFTALIEAQFAEQPPQKLDPSLPNHGRKVLVFSDGRQKAARLAPALEHSHARDLFRQVIALASRELHEQEDRTGLHRLYPGVAWLCGNRGYNLFPSVEEVEFHNHLRRVNGKTLKEALQLADRGGLKPTRSFAQALFSELVDRYYSLPSLALGSIEEDPDFEHVFEDFPDVGLDEDAIRVLFRAWLRLHLERRSFRTDGAELSDLGEGWAEPVGIDAGNMKHVLPLNFEEYLKKVFANGNKGTTSEQYDKAAVDSVSEWFRGLVRNSDMLDFEGDRYYLRPMGLSLNLRLDASWLRCVDCGRIHPEALENTCPACCGELVDADPAYLDARTGFYRDQVLRAFDCSSLEPFGLSAAEHSAQLTGGVSDTAFNKVEEYELRFQDISLDGKPPIDVLSCTTTMEVGIDIGALSGVALRNVPPHVANYQQRAGRAGRRGRSIASVVTYAHGTSHDAHFFDHPADLISGNVRAPIVYVENQQVLERHIYAYLVQRFFHEMVPTDTGSSAYMLFESLGTVEQFLSEVHPCSLERLEAWLTDNEDLLKQELRHWAPTYSFGSDASIPEVEDTIESSVQSLKARLRDVLPVNEFACREQLEGLEREALERRLEDELLQTLIGRAVFPRYAFPTDVVAFWVSRPRRSGDPSGRRVFEYEPQRDLQLALTEYAPGRSLTVDKWRFESAALFSPYEPTPEPTLARRQPYTSCRACSFVSLDQESVHLTLCPCCGSDQISHSEFITPAGFAPDINTKREVDRGQTITYAGLTDRARLEVQDPPAAWHAEQCDGRLRVWTGPRMLAMVNKGVGERGFRVCPDCGRAEPEYGPNYTRTKLTKGGQPINHKHPLQRGVTCTGTAEGPFFLGHRFPTDALLLRLKVESPMRLGTPTTQGLLSRAARMALTSLVEAIALAASRELQIDEGELSGWWAPVLGGYADEAQIYLYDLLPGGAGYARTVGHALDQVLDATDHLLSDCSCTTSCYRCIRHYGNNWIHTSLDRHLALALLRHVRRGEVPSLSDGDKAQSLIGLREYLGLRDISVDEAVRTDGVVVPMQFDTATSRVWLDVHHPLVDPTLRFSEVTGAAQLAFQEVVELDAFTLVHDLPEAVHQLQLPDGATQ